MMPPLSAANLAPVLAGRLVNSVVAGVAVALCAWVLLRVMGRQNSSTRFVVWFSALLVVGALPWLGNVPAAAGAAAGGRSAVTLPESWAVALFAVWFLAAVVGLCRIGIGLWRLRQVRKGCHEIEVEKLDPGLQRTLREFQPIRPVKLCVSDSLRVPTALGFAKAAVVIPWWAWQELAPGDLNSILIHELEHLRRRDDWTNLVQKVLRALLFFHPAVWWIERRLALEREMACDEAVVAETANPRAYAQCLLALAEKSFLRRGVALAQAAVNRMQQTSFRVTQILQSKASGASRTWKPAMYVAAAFALVCIASVSRAPDLVGFESAGGETAAIPAVASARMVPAMYVPARAMAPAKPAAPFVQVRRAARPMTSPPERAAKFAGPSGGGHGRAATQQNPSAIEANIVLASGTDNARLRSMVVVVRTQQYDAYGTPVWTVQVWRLTVFRPRPGADAGNPANRT